MSTASIALSRHVGLVAGRRLAPLRREVGFGRGAGGGIKDGIGAPWPRGRGRAELIRWTSSSGKFFFPFLLLGLVSCVIV